MLTLALLMFTYCIVMGWYLRSVYAALVAGAFSAELVLYINRFTHHLNDVLLSIEQRDYTLRFNEHEHDGQFNKLYRHLNNLSSLFRKMSIEKEIHHRHLETLVSHLTIGIVSYDEEGNIYLVNKAFLNFAGRIYLKKITDLDQQLHDAIVKVKESGNEVIKVEHDGKITSLGLHATDFRLDERLYRLVSVQDISFELNEMKAWHKLIRVLTHEIMNSITPIISLSESLHGMTTNASPDDENWETLKSGLHAIRVRSSGLQSFTQRYREFTHLPSPVFKVVSVNELLEEVTALFKSEMTARNISLDVQITEKLTTLADPGLLQQVVINLLKNSMDALDGREEGKIVIRCYRGEHELFIEVTDNGGGIDPELLDKIFVPFFTTKPAGSGIGLAVARQIVLLHRGELLAQNNDRGVTFSIRL